MKNGVRFIVLGNRKRLSAELEESISLLEEETASNERLTLIVFLSYSGKWDILQAVKKIAGELVSAKASAEDIEKLTIDD